MAGAFKGLSKILPSRSTFCKTSGECGGSPGTKVRMQIPLKELCGILLEINQSRSSRLSRVETLSCGLAVK